MDGLIFSPRRVDNLVDNVRDLDRKANTYSEFVNVAMRVRHLMGRGLANYVNPGNIEPRIWNLYYGRMDDATVILRLTRVYIRSQDENIHSNLSNFLLATSWVLASSKHVRTEHSFYAYFYLYNISSTICIFLNLFIALFLRAVLLIYSYHDTGIGTELSVSVSNSSFMSANSHTTPAHDPKLSHLVRVIVKKEDKFLCIFSIRNVAHIDCSGLEFPGGKVDIGEGLDGVRVNRHTWLPGGNS